MPACGTLNKEMRKNIFFLSENSFSFLAFVEVHQLIALRYSSFYSTEAAQFLHSGTSWNLVLKDQMFSA